MSDREQQENFLSNTPVDVAIRSLQRQVDQLKRIMNKSDEPSSDNTTNNADTEKKLKEEIKALKIAHEKAEYRIKILLRTLEEKDKK